MTKRSKGFSAIELLVVLVVVLAAGFGGWYVWHKNQNKSTAKQPGSSNNTAQSSNAQHNQQQSDPSEGGKYLVISEWGVRFLLPEELRGDVTYSIVTSSSSSTESAWFEVGKIAKLPGSNCKLEDTESAGATGKSGGIGTYLAKTQDEVPSDQTKLLYTTNNHVGNYWYSVGIAKGSCLTDQDNTQLEGDTRRSLANALSSLEQIKD